MRKLIISLLLASVAASPTRARDQSDHDTAREERESRNKEEREERKKASEERRQPRKESQPAKVEAPARPDRTERKERANDAQVPAATVETPASGQQTDRQLHDRQRIERRTDQGAGQPPATETPADRQRYDRQRMDRRTNQGAGQSPATETPADRQRYDHQRIDRQANLNAGQDAARDARQHVDARRQEWDQNRAERLARQQEIRNQRPPVVSPTPRPGTQPPPPPPSARPSTSPTVNWSTNHWRKDRRYDWYKHRNKYWWLFQLGWYSDPFGWGYQPYRIGWRMWPSYYSSQYWLNDSWQYRLPYAPRGTRWVRYWDDAVLVDMWSGQVLDVIYNFFW